jgi:MFS family permease
LASVWAISAVLGPVIGGLIMRHASWAWIFWMNIPIGLLAAAGFVVLLHEKVAHRSRAIDVTGAITFTIAVTALLIALTEAGSSPTTVLVAAAVFCIATVTFVAQERRTPNPMVSFALWSRRPIAAANGVTVLASMALMGLTTFVPIYVQAVLHRSPVVAGLALTTMLFGWPVGATLAARLFHRFGLNQLLLAGASLLPLGAAFFVFLTPASSPLVAGVGSLIMGFGMGILSVSALVLIQEVVEWSQRGSGTASNLFSRNVGNTLGATVLGAVLNHCLTRATGGAPVSSEQLRRVLEMPTGSMLGGENLSTALQHSLNLTFWAMLALSALGALVALGVPAIELKPAKSGSSENATGSL